MLPARIHNAYLFQAFNAVSWQICLGSPLILFARELGAPAVVLGLLVGLAPLTGALQLLVAPHAERIGYRKLMVSGWSARVTMLIFLALLPLSTFFWPPAVVIGVLILILFAFTALRGVATCAWMPWITAIVPRSVRGDYLSRDRTFVGVASVAALAVSGFFLFDHGNMWSFSIVFGLSFLGGATSLYFLNRIPEPDMPNRTGASLVRLRWRDLLHDAAFVRLLTFAAVVQLCVLSTATFITIFVREEVKLQDGAILWITAGAALVGIFGLRLLRSRVDGMGSRPFLGVVFLWWTFYYLAWFLLAAHLIDGEQILAPMLMLAAGFFASIYELSLTRLMMNTVGDRPGTTQYFALQSVIVSLLAGLSPIMWGWMLDHLDNVRLVLGRLTLDSYAIFFGVQWLLLGAVFLVLMQVKEGNATATKTLLYHALIVAPGQRIASITHRTRP
ncbi:MAG: MFS transporter [Caldilinea sp.]